MGEPLDELYLRWLYSQVGNVKIRSPRRTFWRLLGLLYSKEFIWLVPNDDNRLEDGRDLRHQFVEEEGLDGVDPLWMSLGCSMLEMMIAVSHHLTFQAAESPDIWFWRLIRNLGLEFCSDAQPFLEEDVNDILDEVIWRTYNPDGTGGLFPMKHATEDQREVEIWYQMSAYLLEPI